MDWGLFGKGETGQKLRWKVSLDPLGTGYSIEVTTDKERNKLPRAHRVTATV